MSEFYESNPHEFNFAEWPAGTEVMLTNVPWNSDYRDVWSYDTQQQLDLFLEQSAGATLQIKNMTYHRMGSPVRVDAGFGIASQFNYLRARNPAQPINDLPTAYYYFITEVTHISPGTTALTLQLDVWTTYKNKIRLGNCFIEAGHIGVANSRRMDNYGRDYLTSPEGLDLGGEYQISKVYQEKIASARINESWVGKQSYAILVTSTVAFTSSPGTVEAPIMNSATGSSFENLPNGAETYLFESVQDFKMFLNRYSDKPWITQGIIGIMAVPGNFLKRYKLNETVIDVDGFRITSLESDTPMTISTRMADNWREDVKKNIPERYRHLDKLLTYPYTVLELTSHTGTPIVIKPESWSDDHATVVEVAHFAQPAPRIQFYPYRYNAGKTSGVTTDEFGVLNDGGEFLDMATGIFNFPQFSVVNNSYMSFMASNVNSISYQHSAADWSQQKAMTGNQLSYDQSTAGMNLSNDLSQQGIRATQDQANLTNSTQALTGMSNFIQQGGRAAGQGNVAGVLGAAASNAMSTGIAMHQTSGAANISTGLARGQNASTVANQGYVRDSNKDYADFAATGDYQSTMRGINAKLQDAKMIQPTTAGQSGGDAFLLAQYQWGYDLKVKTLQGNALARAGEFFLRYGYEVGRFGRVPQDFHCMSHFTYWKLRETYITNGNMPEKFKQAFRGILEKGVTVWRRPTYIGQIDIGENFPLEGISY